jgi:hypothetical protein
MWEDRERRIAASVERMRHAGFVDAENIEMMLRRLYCHYDESGRRLVIIMSHSSAADALLGLTQFKDIGIPLTAFVSFTNNSIINSVCDRIGLISRNRNSSDATDDSPRSSTSKVCRKLIDMNEFGLLISLGPCTNHRNRVRSGYFFIAKETRAQIVVLGYDFYNTMRGYVSERRWSVPADADYESFRQAHEYQIVDELNRIYPMYPNAQTRFSPERYFERLDDADKNIIDNIRGSDTLVMARATYACARAFPVHSVAILVCLIASIIVLVKIIQHILW